MIENYRTLIWLIEILGKFLEKMFFVVDHKKYHS